MFDHLRPESNSPSVNYTISREDLIDFAHELIEQARGLKEEEMTAATAAESSKNEEYYTRPEVMSILRRCDSTLTKWSRRGYLVPVLVGGKYLYKKADVMKILGIYSDAQ